MMDLAWWPQHHKSSSSPKQSTTLSPAWSRSRSRGLLPWMRAMLQMKAMTMDMKDMMMDLAWWTPTQECHTLTMELTKVSQQLANYLDLLMSKLIPSSLIWGPQNIIVLLVVMYLKLNLICRSILTQSIFLLNQYFVSFVIRDAHPRMLYNLMCPDATSLKRSWVTKAVSLYQPTLYLN